MTNRHLTVAVAALVVTASAMMTSAAAAAPSGPVAHLISSPKTTLSSVSCTSTMDCTAVGFQRRGGQLQPFYATEEHGVWEAMKQDLQFRDPGSAFSGVSCSSAEDCTAFGQSSLGSFTATETNGRWGAFISAGLSNTYLTGISCTSAGHCTAVGQGAGTDTAVYLKETGGMWSAPSEIPLCAGQWCESYAWVEGISCVAATDCTAVGEAPVDDDPAYATETNGKWGPVTELSGSDGLLTAISCTSATDCTAVGDGLEPIRVTETDGAWGAATQVGTFSGYGDFNAVSCTSATDCTAVGMDIDNPIYATESNGSWGPGTEVVSPVSGGSFGGVSCTSATDCTAVGADPMGFALYPTETAGVWPKVPNAPRNEEVTPGNRSVKVVWTPPVRGAHVTDYVVNAVEGSYPVDANNASPAFLCVTTRTTCTLRGLANGKTYTIWVDATNAAGSSANSFKKPRAIPHP